MMYRIKKITQNTSTFNDRLFISFYGISFMFDMRYDISMVRLLQFKTIRTNI